MSIARNDRLGKIRPLFDKLERKYKRIFTPGEHIVIDETLISWRERLIFKQYIPNKAHRYGMKLFKLFSTTGYTCVVSWTKGLRYRPNRKQCRESRGIVGYINVYINVSSPFQVNSFVEKACVALATGVFGTRAR